MLLDAGTRDLAPLAQQVLERAERPSLLPGPFQSMVTIRTGLVSRIKEIRFHLRNAVAALRAAAAASGCELASAGTHPFARSRGWSCSTDPRATREAEAHKVLARRRLVFGLRVTVETDSHVMAFRVFQRLCQSAPLLLAVSASSPFTEDGDTGLCSYRTALIESLPVAGYPGAFKSWEELLTTLEHLRAMGAIESPEDLWWDVRPHLDRCAVDLCVADALPTFSETTAVAALVQALSWRELTDSVGPDAALPDWLYRENKWRAARWGVGAELVDAEGRTRRVPEVVEELIEGLTPIAEQSGSVDELPYVRRLVSNSSASRQRRAHQHHGSLQSVVDKLVWEFKTDLQSPGL